MKKKITECFFWLLLLSPLTWLHVENRADWGDDFAAYYTEARQISEGLPFYQTHFRFYDYNDHYAPPFYAVGYPLLLAPVVRVVGLDMARLGLYMSCWMMAWCLLSIYFLRRYYSLFTVTCVAAIFFLHPFFFELKGRIWSDIPFSFFFLLALLLYLIPGRSVYRYIAAGLCLGAAISIRAIGLVVPISICLDFILSFTRVVSPDIRRERLFKLSVILITAAVLLFLSHFIFCAPTDTYYFHQFHTVSLHSVGTHIYSYALEFRDFFRTGTDAPFHLSSIVAILISFSLVIGVLSSARTPDIISLTCICYILVILVFPDYQGFRYLVPLVPLIAYGVLRGMPIITRPLHLAPARLMSALAIIAIYTYAPGISDMIVRRDRICTYGPFTPASQHGFSEIREILPDSGTIVCVCPRVVALMTGHDCSIIPEGIDTYTQVQRLPLSHPDYLLSISERDPEVIDQIAAAHQDSLIWQGGGFRLYRCKPWPKISQPSASSE